MPSYKSYCWALGTTSFRMVEFNRKIEIQLGLLNEFWKQFDDSQLKWSENEPIQEAYYNFLKEREFIEGDAPRKAKDAREKTSGLVDLGFITAERRLTAAGQSLLNIANNGDFKDDNFLQIPADSFIYFKQLIKVTTPFNDSTVRPFIALAYLIEEFREITKDEFTYLLPLITSPHKAEYIKNAIYKIRDGSANIDECILSILLDMENFKEAKKLFLDNSVSISLIQDVGMNRKSRSYDIPYFGLYQSLWSFVQNKTDDKVEAILRASKSISGKCQTLWKQYLFNTSNTKRILRDGIATVNTTNSIFNCEDENSFKNEFFNLLHLFKAKSLLSDYFDLNKRYFKTTDCVLFEDNIVKFDIVPNCFFAVAKNNLLNFAFEQDNVLQENIDLAEINSCFYISEMQIFEKIEEIYGIQVRNIYDAKNFVESERYRRFNEMIDNKFSDEVLIDLMTKFENRNDQEIQEIVTNNADVPTIFEYILAIVWYKISGRHGKILEFINLSLDADLLPVTHATGGHEDISYKFSASANYPAHTLLIELTLASKTNQRRMEMEPVSRHLGDYMLAHRKESVYCVFTTTFLHVNVVSDFRGRMTTPYYSMDGSEHVDGMKIIPLQTSEIKTILQKNITYAQLYCIFEHACQSNVAPNMWYQNEIVTRL